MLNKGDKVKIKSTLTPDMYDYIPEMEKFAGMELEVIDIKMGLLGRPTYILSGTLEAMNPWRWNSEHFE